MRFAPDIDIGPMDSNEELWAAVQASDDLPSRAETVEELFRYDGTRVAVLKAPDGTFLLETVVDEGERSGADGAPVTIEHVTHYLPFRDEALLRATLNHGFVPTRASYAAAGPVIRTVFSYLKDGGSTSGHSYSCRTVDFDRIAEEERPYAHLRPGRISIHGPYQDPYSDEATAEMETALLSGPDDEVIGYFDGPRTWIVRRPGHHAPVTLVTCLADDDAGYVQHRLHFRDERAMLATLATHAPTMDTYRLATSFRREVIGVGSGPVHVLFEDMDLDTIAIGRERPSFDSAAHHAAEWPQFARKVEGDGIPAATPEQEDKA